MLETLAPVSLLLLEETYVHRGVDFTMRAYR